MQAAKEASEPSGSTPRPVSPTAGLDCGTTPTRASLDGPGSLPERVSSPGIDDDAERTTNDNESRAINDVTRASTPPENCIGSLDDHPDQRGTSNVSTSPADISSDSESTEATLTSSASATVKHEGRAKSAAREEEESQSSNSAVHEQPSVETSRLPVHRCERYASYIAWNDRR